jgi:hypothetical protein
MPGGLARLHPKVPRQEGTPMKLQQGQLEQLAKISQYVADHEQPSLIVRSITVDVLGAGMDVELRWDDAAEEFVLELGQFQ